MLKVITEWFGLNAATKDHLFQLISHGQVQVPLDQVDPRPIQLDHGCYQW